MYRRVHVANPPKLVMSQSAANPRSRMQAGNAAHRDGGAAAPIAPHWNNPDRQHLLADAYIGAPLRLSRQPDLCVGYRWNTDVDDLTKLIYGQKVHVEEETARFLNASPAYLVRFANIRSHLRVSFICRRCPTMSELLIKLSRFKSKHCNPLPLELRQPIKILFTSRLNLLRKHMYFLAFFVHHSSIQFSS